MSTMLIPEAPAPDTSNSREPLRFIPIFANLLPDEIVAGRRARETMRRVVIGLGALVVLLVAWYGVSVVQTSRAKSNLTKAQATTIRLQNQVKSYAPLVAAQAQSAAISKSLTILMKTDVQWSQLINTVRKNASPGMTFDNVEGTIPSGLASKSGTATGDLGGLGVLNDSGKLQVGTLSLSGSAPDRAAVAAFVDKLGALPGFTSPFPASVTATGGPFVKFDVTVLITSDALGGRFTTKPGTTTPEGN